MKTVAIICEYNPFHTGHAYHIRETKRMVTVKTGEDCAVLCVMSPSFVQRGDTAVCDKFSRAEMAVRCGADLVLELPTPYAMSTAEVFASGAVELIRKTGVADFLSFGSECGDLSALSEAAAVLASDAFSDTVKQYLTGGISFASARQLALEQLSPQCKGILDDPNNTLAVSYLMAMTAQGASFAPITVTRSGQPHDNDTFVSEGTHPSASAVRKALYEGDTDRALSMMPPQAAEVLAREIARGRAPVSFDALEPALLSYLRRLTPADYAALFDISEGLENRLYDAARAATTFDDVCGLAKSKRYSYARIRRLYLAAFLEMRKELYNGIPYARVLAFSDVGRKLLKTISQNFPVLTKTAAFTSLDERGQKMFQFESLCTDLYAMAFPGFSERRAGLDFTVTPKYIMRFEA